jgi:PTS system nitrogen regulatory IIA component
MQWTVKEAAEFLKVPEDTIHDWIKERGLPATLFNDRYHFSRIRLIDWALENQVPINIQNEARYPSLPKVLRAGGIYRDIPGEDLSSVLKNIVGSLPLPPGANRDFVWRMIVAREKEGTTALGNGIAIPHARHPIILGVEQALLALCFLKTPLSLETPDGKPVTVLFVMVTSNIQSHLHYLGRLGHILHDAEILRLLQTQGSDAEIFSRLEGVEDALPPAASPHA